MDHKSSMNYPSGMIKIEPTILIKCNNFTIIKSDYV